MNNDIEKLKEFLTFIPYRVLHENCSKNNNIEHYFMVINDERIKDECVKNYLKQYAKVYPVKNLSAISMEYKKEHEHDLHFIFLDSLDNKSASYSKNQLFVKENANNILSIRMLNEPIDIPKHISSKIENYTSEIKDLGFGAGLIAKDAILTSITKGREIYKEKSPQIQEKASKLGTTISNKLNDFRKKF